MNNIQHESRNQGLSVEFPCYQLNPYRLDVVGDTLRGTRGIMLDMYRHPDELIEAFERLTPFMVKTGVASGKATGHIKPFIPLHKGCRGGRQSI